MKIGFFENFSVKILNVFLWEYNCTSVISVFGKIVNFSHLLERLPVEIADFLLTYPWLFLLGCSKEIVDVSVRRWILEISFWMVLNSVVTAVAVLLIPGLSICVDRKNYIIWPGISIFIFLEQMPVIRNSFHNVFKSENWFRFLGRGLVIRPIPRRKLFSLSNISRLLLKWVDYPISTVHILVLILDSFHLQITLLRDILELLPSLLGQIIIFPFFDHINPSFHWRIFSVAQDLICIFGNCGLSSFGIEICNSIRFLCCL